MNAVPSSHGAHDPSMPFWADLSTVSGSGSEWRTMAPYNPYSAMMVDLPHAFSVLRHLARRFWNHTCAHVDSVACIPDCTKGSRRKESRRRCRRQEGMDGEKGACSNNFHISAWSAYRLISTLGENPPILCCRLRENMNLGPIPTALCGSGSN